MRLKDKKLTEPIYEEINHCAFYFLQRIILLLGTEKNIINILSKRRKIDLLKCYNEDIPYYSFFDSFITWNLSEEGFDFWYKQQLLLALMLFMAFPYSTILEQYCENLLLRTSKHTFNKEAISKELINIKKSTLYGNY